MLAIDVGDDGSLIGSVGWDAAGEVGPDGLAGVLVEAEDSIGRPGVVAPAEGYAAHIQVIFVNCRRRRSSAEGGDDAEFFGGLMLPDDFSGFAVQADEFILGAE